MISSADRQLLSKIHTWKHNAVVDEDTLLTLKSLSFEKVVDVGCGDGFYGKLIKGLRDNVFVIGIEKNPIYKDKFELENFYDILLILDIRDTIKDIFADLIIFGDVLEHLEKVDCMNVLKVAVKHSKYILINSPLGFQLQDHEYKEEWHRCGLEKEDFKAFNLISYKEYVERGAMFSCLIKGDI